MCIVRPYESKFFALTQADFWAIFERPGTLRQVRVRKLHKKIHDRLPTNFFSVTTFIVHSFVYNMNSFAGSSRGLLGVMNDDKTDDLLAANGTTLDDTASLESIFFDFGESCKSHHMYFYFKKLLIVVLYPFVTMS